MKKRKKMSLKDKLMRIDKELTEVAAMLEIIKDSRTAHDYINLEIALDIALKRQYDVTEYVSLMY